jgi:uncharacterized membrane protein
MAKAKKTAKKTTSKVAAKATPKANGKSNDGRTYAIVAYITFIGWVIALIHNSEKKNELTSFHIRQSLLIMLCGFLSAIPLVGILIGIATFVFWVMGLISAINGEKKEVPLIGGLAQDWFKSL